MNHGQMQRHCATALVVAGALLASSARAERSPHSEFWQLGLGARLTRVSQAGYDPYSNNDVLPQFSLLASRTVYSNGRLSFAPGVVWDYGGSSENARGLGTSVQTYRLALSLEGRYQLVPGFYATARVAPGFLHQHATLDDVQGQLAASQSAAAVEASLGAAVQITRTADDSARVRLWIGGDLGYAYAPAKAMHLQANLAEGDPRRPGEVDLGPLALRGGFARVYGAVTF